MNLSPVCEKNFVKNKDPSVCPEFWYSLQPNFGGKKDPTLCPEFWYGLQQNSDEKERPFCMSPPNKGYTIYRIKGYT